MLDDQEKFLFFPGDTTYISDQCLPVDYQMADSKDMAPNEGLL